VNFFFVMLSNTFSGRYLQIPVAARSKAKVCGRSFSGTVGSTLARGIDILHIVCCAGSVLYDRPICRPEDC
jgi:hypothetical protein